MMNYSLSLSRKIKGVIHSTAADRLFNHPLYSKISGGVPFFIPSIMYKTAHIHMMQLEIKQHIGWIRYKNIYN